MAGNEPGPPSPNEEAFIGIELIYESIYSGLGLLNSQLQIWTTFAGHAVVRARHVPQRLRAPGSVGLRPLSSVLAPQLHADQLRLLPVLTASAPGPR